jgi:hypothetical protein
VKKSLDLEFRLFLFPEIRPAQFKENSQPNNTKHIKFSYTKKRYLILFSVGFSKPFSTFVADQLEFSIVFF